MERLRCPLLLLLNGVVDVLVDSFIVVLFAMLRCYLFANQSGSLACWKTLMRPPFPCTSGVRWTPTHLRNHL